MDKNIKISKSVTYRVCEWQIQIRSNALLPFHENYNFSNPIPELPASKKVAEMREFF